MLAVEKSVPSAVFPPTYLPDQPVARRLLPRPEGEHGYSRTIPRYALPAPPPSPDSPGAWLLPSRCWPRRVDARIAAAEHRLESPQALAPGHPGRQRVGQQGLSVMAALGAAGLGRPPAHHRARR